MSSPDEDAAPTTPTRLAVYLVEPGPRACDTWRLPPHVLTALRGIRPHVDLLVVGVRGTLLDEDEAPLTRLADEVRCGTDVSHHTIVESLGDEVARFDQVLLTGSGWFGPVADLGAVLERMRTVPVWSLVPRATSGPLGSVEAITVGLDPDWYVMSGSIAASGALAAWRRTGAGLQLESGPSGGAGYAFSPDRYPSTDPVLMNLPQLLDDGLPFVPLRSFGVDPLVADRLAVVPADGFERLKATGIEMSEVWRGLLDQVPLRVLSTNLALTRVIGARPPARTTRSRTAAILHLYYDELTDELMDRVDLLPGHVDVYVTTTDDTRRASIEARLTARARQYTHEVRVVASNRGRDISALLIGCADVIGDESYDLVVKLHGKKSVQDDVNASAWFRRHLFENLLPSAGAVAELYEWFAEDPQLGIAVPPVIHMYYPTLGHAWLGNRKTAEDLAARLGLGVPFDDDTPVAPYGSMFVARRDALVPWLSLGLTWNDFPDGSGYADGTLAHAVERMFCYVAAGTGRFTATVLGPSVAGTEYGFLEYKVQAVGSKLPAYAIDQVALLETGHGTWRSALARRLPGFAAVYRTLRRRAV